MTQKLAAVLGANCKRIRTAAGVSQDELARHARDYGLKWTASAVGNFESGRTAPAFATVLVVCLALEMATSAGGRKRQRVLLSDLIRSDEFVSLTDTFSPRATRVADFCAGEPWDLPSADVAETAGYDRVADMRALAPGLFGTYGMRVVDVEQLQRRTGQDEYRLARRLGIDSDRLLAESFRLWQRTFSEQRDKLAGPDANAQKRGQVSRQLRAELERALHDGDD